MPLRKRSRQRQFMWFIIDSRLWWDDDGWLFWLRTPLFGLTARKDWEDWNYVDTLRSSISFGLICKQMCEDGDMMYFWNWERTLSHKPIERHNAT